MRDETRRPRAVARSSPPRRGATAYTSNAPIDFSADTIELQDRANRAVLAGNVAVKQADMTLNSSRLTVAYTGKVQDGSPQVSRLDASGGVTVRRPDQTARSQYAVYDINKRLITMLGAVTPDPGGQYRERRAADDQPGHRPRGDRRVVGRRRRR